MFPNNPLEAIPSSDELYSTEVGADLSNVQFIEGAGGGKGFPRLEGVKVGGRWAIIYSKYGIGFALERNHEPVCKGYLHDDSINICINILNYAHGSPETGVSKVLGGYHFFGGAKE